MHSRRHFVALAAACSLIVAGCSDDDTPAIGTESSTSTTDTTGQASTDGGPTSASSSMGSEASAVTSAVDSSTSGTTAGGSDSSTGAPQMCESPSPYAGDGECDPYAQDCPDGEKCIAAIDGAGIIVNTTVCAPIDPAPAGLGEPCSVEPFVGAGVDTCDFGLQCWDPDINTNMGRCFALCDCGPDVPECAEGSLCVQFGGGVLPHCRMNCDPRLDECDEGQLCVDPSHVDVGMPPAGSFVCSQDLSAASLIAGEPCTNDFECSSGTLCLLAALVPQCAGAACCTALCDDTGNGEECTVPGAQCVSVYADGEAPVAELETLGYCGM